MTAPPPIDQLRVTGRLTEDARLVHSTGVEPHAFLYLQVAPAIGLPYRARVDLGTELADHMGTEALLPALRTGAIVSVAGSSLQLRTDHHHAVLSIQHARHVLILQGPATAPAAPALQAPAHHPTLQPQEGAHAH